MATSEGAKTAKTWFQGKRVPLYILVGGSLIGARFVSLACKADCFGNCSTHISHAGIDCNDVIDSLRLPRHLIYVYICIYRVAGAASYLSTRATHPHVESSKLLRQDPVPEERESAAGEGAAHKESTGRKTTR